MIKEYQKHRRVKKGLPPIKDYDEHFTEIIEARLRQFRADRNLLILIGIVAGLSVSALLMSI